MSLATLEEMKPKCFPKSAKFHTMKKTFPNYYSTHQREDPARDLVFEEQI
jgi:HJR/Mrr/RecB family endonuclease